MADEINATFVLAGEPAGHLAAWRADAPAFLAAGGYRQADDSYESLVYEADVTTGFVKVAMFGMAKTLYRLTFTFRPEGDATKVGVLGQAQESTRNMLADWVAEHGQA